MNAARVCRLTLSNFRSYHSLALASDARLIALIGPNGAGKTNVLEAVSLFSPGRGLRRATLEEMAFWEGNGSWAVAATITGPLGLATLGTGIDPPGNPGGAEQRRCRIDGETASSASAFSDHLRLVWLTPAMDGLFSGPASERRRFLDRLALALDPSHSARVSALERSLRARNRLLEAADVDARWLTAAEHETAELAVAVAATRMETVRRLGDAVLAREGKPLFPSARLELRGWLEAELPHRSAAEIEDRYRANLRENRGRDAAAGRTTEGPHLSDLVVTYAEKGIPAAAASTGEQKALIIGLILAHAHLVTEIVGSTPVLLLDEVVAHLDPNRRCLLYEILETLGAQVWLTGADPASFAELRGRAAMFEISPGQASPIA